MRNLSLYSIILLSFSSWTLKAQIPSQVPKPSTNTPVDINNTADLILYIILPGILILSVIIFKLYKKWYKK